jgi:hypothetical protein
MRCSAVPWACEPGVDTPRGPVSFSAGRPGRRRDGRLIPHRGGPAGRRSQLLEAAEHRLDAPAVLGARLVLLDRPLAVAAAGDDRDMLWSLRVARSLLASWPRSAMGRFMRSASPRRRSAPRMPEVLPGVRTRRSGRPRRSTRAQKPIGIVVVRPPRETPMAWAQAPLLRPRQTSAP